MMLRLVGLSWLLLIGLVACPQPVQIAPKIVSFTATPSSLSAPATVKLEWTVSNSSSLSISPRVGVVTGSSVSVDITANTTFELIAQNSAGIDKKTVLVTLQSPLFDPNNAWKAPIPSNAEQVSPEVFRQRVEAGELLPTNDTTRAAQENAAQQQYQTDLSLLRVNPSEAVRELLNASGSTRSDPETTLPSGEKVLLLGQRSAARELALSLAQSQNLANALGLYSSLYELAPAELQAQVPLPIGLQGQALSVVQTALNTLNSLLGSEAALDGTRPETVPTPLRTQAIIAGSGYDNNLFRPDCRSPSGLFARFRFPLKYFVSPIKNQAVRGLCWAFTALGAIESRERVQNNNVVDLSEQFLAFKVKAQWSPSDFEDGFSTALALDQANANLQILPNEAFWTYNPAFGRQEVLNDLAASYAKSCDWQIKDRPDLKYNGTCSNSAHQGNAVCTSVLIGAVTLPFCATQTENYAGAGTLPSSSRTIWASGQPFLLATYRTLLAQGYTLMASFPVYQGFLSVDSTGFLTNRSRVGLTGNHAVQIVGFIGNDSLSAPTDPQNAPGGGYFIIKNSWGCMFGDGGYAYIDAQYVQDVFHNLTALNFDSRRSPAWVAEQSALVAPQVIPVAAPRQVNVRLSSNLGALFRVSHPQVEVKNVTFISALRSG